MHTLRVATALALGSLLIGSCGAAGEPRPAPLAAEPRPAPLAAKKGWSKAANISKAKIGVNWNVALAFTGDGHALATLDGRGEGQVTSVLAADRGSSTFAKIADALLLAPPAPYGSNGVAYLRVPTPNPTGNPGDAIDSGPVTELGVSLGSVPGSLGELQPLARFDAHPRDVQAAISGNARGAVAAAWVQPAGKRMRLHLALREPGRGFGAPQTIADERFLGRVVLAYGAGGDLVIAFERGRPNGDLAARVMRPAGQLGETWSLGPTLGSSSISTAVAPDGQAVVAWGTQRPSAEIREASSAWSVRAAMLGAGVPRFAPTRLLDPGRDVAPAISDVHAAIAPDGTATVVWTGLGVKGVRPPPYAGRPYPCPVRAATSKPGGRFGPAEQVARNGAAIGVVTARDGTTTALWGLFARPEETDDYVESLDRVYASRRTPRARRFARPRPLAAREPVKTGGALALDPSSQRPSALWIQAVGGSLGEGLYDFPPVQALYARGPDSASGLREAQASGARAGGGKGS